MPVWSGRSTVCIYSYIHALMSSPKILVAPEDLHPSLWRASQLAVSATRCVDTGHPTLSTQLPDGGWPRGALVDLHIQKNGVGELRLLAPALRKVAHKSVVFLQPPHAPQAIALAGMGLAPSQLIWLKSGTSADALWAAETVLRAGSVGSLLFWSAHIRPESLRRLNLAAQAGETLFYVLRPLAAAQDASPAPLRLGLRPAPGGIEVQFLKRRGPQRDERLFVPLPNNGRIQQHRPAARPAPARQVESAPSRDTVQAET